MPILDGNKPIGDEEILYRRVPVSQNWYDPTSGQKISSKAFAPRPEDTTGLSLSRDQEYNTPEQAAKGPSKKGYYVACVRAGDLRKSGLRVVPRPIDGNPGHAEIENLTASIRDSNEGLTFAMQLAEKHCYDVIGPFIAKPDSA
jgi:hypothetical protein